MKNKKLLICLSCLMVLTLFVTGCKKEVDVKNGKDTAVSISGENISATDYYAAIKETNISTLVDMIDTKLLEEKYKTTKEEDEQVEKQISSLKTNYSDEDTLKNVLRQYFGVTTLEELEEMLRLEYKRNQAVKDFISDNLKDNEIEKYYKENIYGEVKASHILIMPSVSNNATEDERKKAEDEALKTAKEVIKKLNDGEDFDKLAKKYSNETATAKNGGDLGYIELDEMVDEFSDAVKKLKIDEYTKEPVKTKYGYHIILKTGEKDKPKLKDKKEDIKERLTAQKLDEDVTLYYQTLINIRKENNIKWNDTVLEKKYNNLMDELIETAKKQAEANQ